MIESVHFKNFKVLREATLPLQRFTLIVGPNGSGKSTALQGISALRDPQQWDFDSVKTAGLPVSEEITITAKWREDDGDLLAFSSWRSNAAATFDINPAKPNFVPGRGEEKLRQALRRVRIFSLNARVIARPVELQPQIELGPSGENLAVVLDRLRDDHPERFEALNQELGRWLPEFDRILFETPDPGQRAIMLRTQDSAHSIKAKDLSHGTLIALALLTLAYLPDPPSIICLEEPDHGLHPRLLRDVKDAIYRLTYPESCGEKREPVQVIATTHNPYFLDLFREHPEEVVIAEKIGLDAKFSRLSDRADMNEILADAQLGEVWYSGVLGGVPVGT